MVTGQDDSGLLTGDVGRSIHAVISLVEGVLTREEPTTDGRGAVPADDGDHRAPAANRADGHETLVPPGERLLGILERNGGRMKQSDVVDVVEWSESTVSRKLGELESAEAISRYRIGRGKVVFLPGAEPDCIGSPFEREEEEEEPPIAA